MLEKAKSICQKLMAAGAKDCLMVGGCVRDFLIGQTCADIDLEVYGLSYSQIVGALKQTYQVNLVGESFGIVKIDNQIDVSIPRLEKKLGHGHTGFETKPDPHLTYREAASRRDFTINSISRGFDGKIIDPFNGQKDLKKGILRATSSAFKEDPLRVLRGMQFASRFGFTMEKGTINMCREMSSEFSTLSKERIFEEWLKWAKGKYPGKGLQILLETGWIEHFPALAKLPNTPQNPLWHPEGDVFTHTGYVCDAAVIIAERREFSQTDSIALLLASLLHDTGKGETTFRNEKGLWVSPKHADVGASIAKDFLLSMKAPGWLIKMVEPLVKEHMIHINHSQDIDPSYQLIRRLANRLSPANIRLWAALCESDSCGCPPLPKRNPVENWEAIAQKLSVQEGKPKKVLLGRHLIERGLIPGTDFGKILNAAYQAQLDGEFSDLAGALAWLDQNHVR